MKKMVDKIIIPLLITAVVFSMMTVIGGIMNSKGSGIVLGALLVVVNGANLVFQFKRKKKINQENSAHETGHVRASSNPAGVSAGYTSAGYTNTQPNSLIAFRPSSRSEDPNIAHRQQVDSSVGSIGQEKTKVEKIKAECKKLEAEQALYPHSIGDLEI